MRVVTFSKINLHLATQLSRMTRNGPPYVTLKTLIAPECGQNNASGIITTPLEDILNSTRQYLDLLFVIADSPRYLATSARAASVPQNSLACRSASSNTSTTSSSENDSSESCDGISSALTPPNSATSGTPPNKSDTATLLIVYLCYIHVPRLHVALFAHIRQYSLLVSENDDRTANPLPGLCGFDSFSLRE